MGIANMVHGREIVVEITPEQGYYNVSNMKKKTLPKKNSTEQNISCRRKKSH